MFDRKLTVKLMVLVFSLAVILAVSSSEAAAFTVSVSEGRLSVKAEDASLTGIFQEIASQAGFELLVQLEPDIKVSANFKDFELAEGIKKLHKNTIIVYQDSQIVRVMLGTGQSSAPVNDLARFFLEVFPGLKSEARILDALKGAGSYPLISAAVSDIINSPQSWKAALISLSRQVTPEIREELFGRINDQLAAYANEQGILSGVSQDDYNPSRILVRFKDSVASEDVNALEKLTGTVIERQFVHISSKLYQLSVPDNLDVSSLLVIYNNHPLVEYAEADYIVYANTTAPNDPSYSSLYAHPLTEADQAWDIITGHSGVIVAVIDTGVQYDHPDLAANMWTNPDEIAGNSIDDDGNGYVDDVYGIDPVNSDGDPMDDNGHGTHVAGTIGAVGNNGIGVAGVIWRCRIMALKAFSAAGTGSTSDEIACIDYAVAKGAHVSNNSWGGTNFSQALKDAVSAMNTANILFVAAAGNDGTDNDTTPFYPSGFDVANVISVAASDSSDNLAGFSNYGAASVDLAAPGVSIYSTYPTDTYASLQGTSMAAPYVTGIIALMLARDNPGGTLNPAQVRQRLLDTADKVSAFTGKLVSGGRVNTNGALTGQTLSPAKRFAGELEKKKHDDCFIATASYGSSLARPVSILARFRDRYLLANRWGREFVEFYYKHSPPIAVYISDKPLLKFVVRMLLWPLVFFSWLALMDGSGTGFLILAGIAVTITARKFLLKPLIGLLITGCFFITSRPVYAQDSRAAGKDWETHEELETVDNLSDVGSRIGVRFKLGHAYDRNSSAEFFDESNVEFGVDSTFFYEGEVFYGLPINEYYHLGLGLSAAYLKRDFEVDDRSGRYSDYFGTITTVPVLANIENRFVLEKTVAVFLRLGLGYSFNQFKKGDSFDDLERLNNATYKAKADRSFAYRIGAGFEYFIDKRFSAVLMVDYLGMKPKIGITELQTNNGVKTRSNPEISLNSFILSLGVSFYFEPDFSLFHTP